MNEAMVTREHLAGLELARQRIAPEINDEKLLDELIAQASAAPEQEPVAWMVDKTIWENRSSAARYAAGRMLLVRPLYSHADDGEVERLRADLAEAQALLRSVDRCGLDSTPISGPSIRSQVKAYLSANAQPAECCTPTEAELKLIADGEYRAEELWGGPSPTCRKCIGNPAVKQSEEAKNAARYRWLRDEALHVDTESPGVVVVDEYGNQSEGLLYGEKLDLAIDAALSSEEVSGHE